jgi:hypothetical protein
MPLTIVICAIPASRAMRLAAVQIWLSAGVAHYR